MSDMTLEVGKVYRNALNERVKIILFDENEKKYPFVGVKENGETFTFMINGRHCIRRACANRLIAEWTDEPTEPQEPPINWGGELQISDPDELVDDWDDMTVLWHNNEMAIGWINADGPGNAGPWRFTDWQFRNKPPEPPEPKRVKLIAKAWRDSRDILQAAAYIADGVVTVESVKQWHGREPKLLAVVEIDVPEGEGL